MARRDADDDDAPWLAEAGGGSARGRDRTDVSKRSFFWTALVLLTLAAVIAVGLILLLSKKDGGSAQGYMDAEQAPLITAEPGPYKIPPVDPKGMRVEGQDQTIYAAGEGIDQGSVIDQSAGPEAVLPRPGTAPAAEDPAQTPAVPPPGPPRDLMPGITPPAASVAKPVVPPAVKTVVPPAPKPAVPAPASVPPTASPAAAKPKPDPVAPKPDPAVKKPGTVQLGAFSTPEKANDAWARLAPRHGLSGKRVIAVEANGQTLYRLRASGDSAQICAKLRAAGDACAVVE